MSKPDIVFECSFEVCNKVGGIYAVLKSKAAYMSQHYGEDYYTIGYYQPEKARIEFEPTEPPREFKEVFDELKGEGVQCLYGRWLIPGRPKTILVNSTNCGGCINDVKKWLWEEYQVDSIQSDDWFNHPVVWNYYVGKLVDKLSQTKKLKGKKIVGHFHEWMSGTAILYLKGQGSNVGTVFTTHATMLGRTMAGVGKDLYKIVNEGLERGETATHDTAKAHSVQDKHSMEVACAKSADVFTTVSTVTGKEAEYILGVKPDVYLFNGVDCGRYPGLEELTVLRRKYRSESRKFLTAYFNRYYSMDLYNIRSVYISGRYEFHNKGLDVFIDALGRVNRQMRDNGYENHLVAFIFVPAGQHGENFDVLKNVALFQELFEHVDEELPEIRDRIVQGLADGKLPEKVYTDGFIEQSRKMIAHFKEKEGQNPPLCSFQLDDMQGDPVMNHLWKNQLLNRKEDKVKIVFYPAYLSSADRMLGLDYNEATLTCDMGVFPSFYEPWGYTPLESAAQATPSVTTDLAGYGRFMKGKGDGVRVLSVEGRSYDDIVEQLSQELMDLASMPSKELSRRRISAKNLALEADWKVLSENYFKAHELACGKK